MCGKGGWACMVKGGAWVAKGCVHGDGGMCGEGGMCGKGGWACMVKGGHAWQRGAYMVTGVGEHAW